MESGGGASRKTNANGTRFLLASHFPFFFLFLLLLFLLLLLFSPSPFLLKGDRLFMDVTHRAGAHARLLSLSAFAQLLLWLLLVQLANALWTDWVVTRLEMCVSVCVSKLLQPNASSEPSSSLCVCVSVCVYVSVAHWS